MAEDDAPWSTLGFAEEAAVFKGPTQNARVLSEGWVAAHAFCPGCGATPLTAFAANAPVADFHCGVCAEEYELKATKGRTDGRDPSHGGWRKDRMRSDDGLEPPIKSGGSDAPAERVRGSPSPVTHGPHPFAQGRRERGQNRPESASGAPPRHRNGSNYSS